MNFNFTNFLSKVLKVLNIVNRSIPLVKDVSPSIKKYKNLMKNNNVNTKETKYIHKEKNKSNNVPTFFN